MGYYIQAPSNKGKAEYLVQTYGAERLPDAPEWQNDKAIICVVDNGAFEAAGFAYDPRESWKHSNRPTQVAFNALANGF